MQRSQIVHCSNSSFLRVVSSFSSKPAHSLLSHSVIPGLSRRAIISCSLSSSELPSIFYFFCIFFYYFLSLQKFVFLFLFFCVTFKVCLVSVEFSFFFASIFFSRVQNFCYFSWPMTNVCRFFYDSDWSNHIQNLTWSIRPKDYDKLVAERFL